MVKQSQITQTTSNLKNIFIKNYKGKKKRDVKSKVNVAELLELTE